MDRAAHPRASALRFTKMHGAGNDFVVLDLRDGMPAPSADLCRALADRRTGVGCDQILTIERPRSGQAVAAYRIWNSDGSSSQQCGNGARCVAAWLVRDGAAGSGDFALDSPAGTHAVQPLGGHRYRIAMGVPDFAPQAVPLAGFDAAQDEYSVDIDGDDVRFGAVSMGNPHAVLEVLDAATAPVATLGPALQRSGALPQSGNIGFAEVVSRDRIRLRVFERGVGETLACGSGACAAAAVMMRRGRVDREVAVVLPGGELRIAWPDDTAQISMAGPAAFVYEGEWLP
ncbi:diaminopimelate epimerase [Luteimonas sp. SX5]|uniref:Diaminopimelate epimerase n=1 Tax=Luteimonas galliterrae TaxID=2940486 RepID=A0ABT0MJ37_9GAMM|nr:diaminopimelate epimerase [Luteimonas galliterrae]MCL1634880.1 diaminopimelate epimerase [Luteimonas galliterrae]